VCLGVNRRNHGRQRPNQICLSFAPLSRCRCGRSIHRIRRSSSDWNLNGGVLLVLRVKTDDACNADAAPVNSAERPSQETVQQALNTIDAASRSLASPKQSPRQATATNPRTATAFTKSNAPAHHPHNRPLKLTLVERRPPPRSAAPMDICHRTSKRASRDSGNRSYLVQRRPPVTGKTCGRPAARREQSARVAHPEHQGARRFAKSRATTTAAPGHRPRQPRPVRGHESTPASTIRADRRRQPRRDDRAGHQPELGGAARGPRVCR
jgi:hypothetical protein